MDLMICVQKNSWASISRLTPEDKKRRKDGDITVENNIWGDAVKACSTQLENVKTQAESKYSEEKAVSAYIDAIGDSMRMQLFITMQQALRSSPSAQ